MSPSSDIEKLNRFEKRRPDAVRLAELVSIAAYVEPELLREARVTLAPAIHASAEADLWFSPLVEGWSATGFSLRPGIAELLRARLRNHPLQEEAFQLVRRWHADLPAVLLQEKVAWLAALRGEAALGEIEEELGTALRAMMVNEQRAEGVSRWAVNALPRFPAFVRETATAQLLAFAAAYRTGARWLVTDAEASFPQGMGSLLPREPSQRAQQKVPVRMCRTQDGLEFVRADQAGHLIHAPATTPVLVELQWNEGNTPTYRVVTVTPGKRVAVPKSVTTIGVRLVDGSRFELRDTLRSAAPGVSKPLNEFKIVLVGRGGVGKTTLVHRLVTDTFKEFKRTPGIQITHWPTTIGGNPVRAHVWNFGGQEIMHGTHRFFMTERALYLVLISGREGTEDHDAEYWLSMVRSFAGEAPIIVLLHKWGDYPFELNRELLREKYGRSLVFIETDSSTGHGFSELREQIRQLAAKLPGLRAAWPLAWRRVKDELPQLKKSWMTFDDFLAFCQERGISDRKEQESLAEHLHDLGLMLSYRKDEALRDFGVLSPPWVTKGIYTLLNSPVLRDAGGRFTLETFGEVLPTKAYPKAIHPYLLALLRKFRLCHPLDEKGRKYLIPELLSKEEPKLDADFPPDRCLGFVYRYDTIMPEGLLPRFIVETYVHREPKLAWRTGVVLERANCRALVRADLQGRTITIHVTGVGNGRRELLGIIREHFERIHRSYEKLPVTELVPMPGYPNALVKHELLIKYELSGRAFIPVEVGDEVFDFSVKELLEGSDLPGVPRGNYAEHPEPRDSLSVFVCYSRKDERFLDELRAALIPYERKGELTVWADDLVEPGQTWDDEVLSRFEQAQLIILLLSNDFLRSSYCIEKELPRAMARRAAGECEIVPIVIRPCRYDKLDLGTIQVIQPGGKPVTAHERADSAWLEVTQRLDRVLAKLKRR